MLSYPWYIDDWRSSDAVADMNCEERGIYRELLDQCWREGSLPNSERALQNFARATDKEWSRSRAAVLACFYEESGRLFSRKVSGKRAEIIEKKDQRTERNKANGLNGGRPKKPKENPVGFQTEPRNNPHGTPSPSPSPSVAADAATAELIERTTNELHRLHAAAGFSPGVPRVTEAALSQVLANAVNPDHVAAAILAAHPRFVPSWRERVKQKPGAFIPSPARWLNDGEYLHPPAVIAAAPVVREFDRALVPK